MSAKRPTDEKLRSVTFEQAIPAQMIAIDGTWRRSCMVKTVSDISASLFVEGGPEGLSLKEFFLAFSTYGSAYRRCQLERVDGPRIDVRFLRNTNSPAKRVR
jgi:hypothetical protein